MPVPPLMVSVLVMVSEDADGIALKGHELDCKLRPIYKVMHQLKCPLWCPQEDFISAALLRQPRNYSDENRQCVPVDRG